jgi:hypothetical protein
MMTLGPESPPGFLSGDTFFILHRRQIAIASVTTMVKEIVHAATMKFAFTTDQKRELSMG